MDLTIRLADVIAARGARPELVEPEVVVLVEIVKNFAGLAIISGGRWKR
jgi:predicted GNAT family acetyltransferase